MEKIIKKSLMPFLEQHRLLSDAQHGFRSGGGPLRKASRIDPCVPVHAFESYRCLKNNLKMFIAINEERNANDS
nr:unnamed protein product [Spirometra erinaceieuropaei]